MPGAPIHLRPTAELADRVLLPGDPGRALLLAQTLLESPRMFNHARGLWGYTGKARRDGGALTIQSTGMGGPSAAIVISELLALGARTLIRVGTCGALTPQLELGQLVIARAAIGDDGASRALGAGEALEEADAALTAALTGAAGASGVTGTVVSVDLFYDPDGERERARRERWLEAGAIAVEMEAATLLALARLHGRAAGCLLAVSDQLAGGGRKRIDDERLKLAGERLGDVAVAALARVAALTKNGG